MKTIWELTLSKIKQCELNYYLLLNLFITTVIIISLKWVWIDYYMILIARFTLTLQTTSSKKISAAKNYVKKLYKLWQELCLWLIKVQEWMMIYYNICHVLKQFKIDDFVKLSIKNLKLKCQKLSSCWIELFRMLKQIDDQTYRLALFTKYD